MNPSKHESYDSLLKFQNTHSKVYSEGAELITKVYGYCDKSIEQIECEFRRNRIDRLTELGGEYTLVCESSERVVIITSRIGAIHYFYFYDGQEFYHSQHILDIVKASGISWQWNWESLGDLCELENLTENRTLHPYVYKVPAGCILKFDGINRICLFDLK